jgi:hypothetical protein
MLWPINGYAYSPKMAKIAYDFRPHVMLLNAAKYQFKDAQFPIAVVTVQMAFELRVEQSFRLLCDARVDLPVETMLSLLPDRTFMNSTTRQLWDDLTDDVISKATAWKAYHVHIEERNAIAHGRAHTTDYLQAERSMTAVWQMIDHVDVVTEKTLRARGIEPALDTLRA